MRFFNNRFSARNIFFKIIVRGINHY